MAFKRKTLRKVAKLNTAAKKDSAKSHLEKDKPMEKDRWCSESTLNRLLIIFAVLNFGLYFIGHTVHDESDTNLRQVVTEANAATGSTDGGDVDTSENGIESAVEPAAEPTKPVENPKTGSITGRTTLDEKTIESVLKSGRTNLALKKAASQSETQKDIRKADMAVNGDRSGTITHTTGCNPWWQVDLGSVQEVKDVIIFNRIDAFRGRLSDFTIAVLNKVSDKWEVVAEMNHVGPAHEIAGFNFQPSAKGQIVRVHMNGCEILHMRQVEVYGP